MFNPTALSNTVVCTLTLAHLQVLSVVKMNLNIFGSTVSLKGNQTLKHGLTVDEQSKLSLLLIIICSCLPAAVLFTYFVAVIASTLLIDGVFLFFFYIPHDSLLKTLDFIAISPTSFMVLCKILTCRFRNRRA